MMLNRSHCNCHDDRSDWGHGHPDHHRHPDWTPGHPGPHPGTPGCRDCRPEPPFGPPSGHPGCRDCGPVHPDHPHRHHRHWF